MWVNAELNASDAFVVAWLPGTEGSGVAEVLFKNKNGKLQHDFTGKLAFSWPKTPTQIVNRFDNDYQPLLPYGFGLSVNDDNVLMDNLNEEIVLNETDSSAMSIFSQGVTPPWQMSIFSGQQSQKVIANSHQLASLTYRTKDHKVQEDAFNLRGLGGETSGVVFTQVSAAENNNIAKTYNHLVVTLRMNEKLTGNVTLGFDCDKTQSDCLFDYSISEKLKNLSTEQWHDITIPMACFNDLSANEIITPAQLSSSVSLFSPQSFDLDIYNLVLLPLNEGETLAICP